MSPELPPIVPRIPEMDFINVIMEICCKFIKFYTHFRIALFNLYICGKINCTMLLDFDTNLFYWINSGWSNPLFDIIMPFLRNKYVWIPFYIFIASFFLFNFGKKGYFLVLFMVLTASTSDMVSNHLFKKQCKRIRPCNTELSVPIIQRVPCGSGYSFTSNHAANHFAIATFLALILGLKNRKIVVSLFIWALSISLAQVYVGLHYPFDILGGAMIGILTGLLYSSVFFRRIGFDSNPNPVV